jgi:hypothetical protein
LLQQVIVLENPVMKESSWKKSHRPNLALSMSIPIIFPKVSEISKDSDLNCVKGALKSNIKNAQYLLSKLELLDSVAT